MGTSKRYNSVPVKDNCALFAPTRLFSGHGVVSRVAVGSVNGSVLQRCVRREHKRSQLK